MKKVLAHTGLGLVTYGALCIFLLFTFITATPSDKSEIFSASFFNFFATFMIFWGWILIIPALVISIRGLLKKENLIINTVTLISSLGWFAVGYWVMTHFA